jgi:uncharacterized LabA/DUF88 family protein
MARLPWLWSRPGLACIIASAILGDHFEDAAEFAKGLLPMHIHPEERIALFIDGANLYATAKALGFDIDYKKLLALFRTKGRLIRANYYTALVEDTEYSPIRPLIDWLDYNGYSVVTKPAKEFTDAMGRRKIKGNMDIELAVDAMELADRLDHLILFSGDGDFRSLVEAIQRKGLRVSVASTLATKPAMVADDLRRQADEFIDLAQLKDQIGRPPIDREPRRERERERDREREREIGPPAPPSPEDFEEFVDT